MNTLKKSLSVFLIAAVGGVTSVTVYKQLEDKKTAKSILEDKRNKLIFLLQLLEVRMIL